MHPIRFLAPLLLVVSIAAGCDGLPLGGATPTPTGAHFFASGTGAGLELMTALTRRFSALHPEVVFTLEDVGQDSAVANVGTGHAHFGFISRELKPEETDRVRSVPFAAVGTGVAVNPANPITGLTKDQIRRIYAGEITDWAQLGAPAGEIRPFLREVGSATRASFESYFFGGSPAYGANVVNISNAAPMFQALRDFRTGVGMVTVEKTSVEDSSIRILAIDGVSATTKNVNSGVYPVRRPIILLLPDTTSPISPRLRDFFDFILSPEGQGILAGF
ncbi:MAG: substrate-binding domain-containing protein [Chloroflexota bacterium]